MEPGLRRGRRGSAGSASPGASSPALWGVLHFGSLEARSDLPLCCLSAQPENKGALCWRGGCRSCRSLQGGPPWPGPELPTVRWLWAWRHNWEGAGTAKVTQGGGPSSGVRHTLPGPSQAGETVLVGRRRPWVGSASSRPPEPSRLMHLRTQP